MLDVQIRPEHPEDAEAVTSLVAAAFADEGENTARFVRAVRQHAQVLIAEVATAQGQVVGHAQWCDAPILVDGFPVRAAYLACLSVDPARQRQGLGSGLVERGLAHLRGQGFQAVTLLGDPTYYARFGFSSSLAHKIKGPHRLKGPGFQALQLEKRALDGMTLVSDYPPVITPP
jgi:putative acetyltransferase